LCCPIMCLYVLSSVLCCPIMCLYVLSSVLCWLKRWAAQTPPKDRRWIKVLTEGNQFLRLIRYPPCYSYSQVRLKCWKLWVCSTKHVIVKLLSPIMCLYVLSSVLWCPLRCPHKHQVRFAFTSNCLQVYVICVYLRIVVSNTYCVVFCQFLCIVHFFIALSVCPI
jgi:hypothetical protein